MSSMDRPSYTEIDGRIATIIQQRNAALDQAILLGGAVAKLEQELKERNEKLAELLKQIEVKK